jgi:hypothetical protein
MEETRQPSLYYPVQNFDKQPLSYVPPQSYAAPQSFSPVQSETTKFQSTAPKLDIVKPTPELAEETPYAQQSYVPLARPAYEENKHYASTLDCSTRTLRVFGPA